MQMNTANASTQREMAYPAHLGWRILAIIYDAVPMIAILMVVSAILRVIHGVENVTPNSLLGFFQNICYWIVVGCYAVISWRRGGQTMGMRPWRLMVVTRDGKNASLKSLILRYAVVSLSGGLALLWCLFDAQKRGLHDIATGTLVVRKDASAAGGTGKNSSR